MSYDLCFWAYENESTAHDDRAVYERLADGETVEGLRQIPIKLIRARFAATFRAEGWTTPDDGTSWESVRGGNNVAFRIDMASQAFTVNCHGLPGDDMNLVIDVGLAFGLRLYDPQVNERFAGSAEAAVPVRGQAGFGRLLSRFRGNADRPN